MKTHPAWTVLCLILTGVAVLLAVVGYFSYSHAQSLLHSGLLTQGVVIANEMTVSQSDAANGSDKLTPTYQARIRFRTGAGQEVEFLSAGSQSPEYAVHSVVPVIYDPRNPAGAMLQRDASGSSSLAGAMAPAGIALFFAALAFLLLVLTQRKLAWLRQNGRRVNADFVRVETRARESYDVYHVVCQWVDPETRQTHKFTSHPLFSDPSAALAGKKVEVLMDPGKPKRYFIDLAPRADLSPSLEGQCEHK
jgi:hypothetical protein